MTAIRIKHNSDLAQAFITKMNTTSRYPKVLEQVASLPLEVTKLVRFGYNPSILEDEGCLLMAYRYHDGNTLSTKLAMAQVGFDGKVLSNRTLELPGNAPSAEDPKLFRHHGQVWMCWVESNYPERPLSAVMKYGRLDGNTVVNTKQPTPPNPKAIEKNWCPLPGDTVRFIYESEPEQKILELDGDKVVLECDSPGPVWPYGPIRGGTPPIEYKGKWLRFFHSGLDNEFDGWRRRYFVGAALMDSVPPFTTLAVSTHPVLFGSEVDDLRGPERRQCVHYKPRVVFPGGAVAHDGHFLVAVGINDSACAILKIGLVQLNLGGK